MTIMLSLTQIAAVFITAIPILMFRNIQTKTTNMTPMAAKMTYDVI